MSPNVRNRAFETPKFNVKKPSKSVLNSRQNSHLNKNYSIINRGYGRSYNAYFLNPYDPFYHHHHYYFDDWIFHDTYTTQQQQILMQQGISPDSVKKPAVTTYWVKVKDKKTDDEPKMINVTKDQFNMIKSGQNIRVSKGIIYVDGKEIK